MLSISDFTLGLLVTLDTESEANKWLIDKYPNFIGHVGEVYLKNNQWYVWWPSVCERNGRFETDSIWYAGALKKYKP